VNDEAYEAQKARVQALIDRWVKTIGLGWWRITYVHRRSFSDIQSAGGNYEEKMRCEANWRYGHACITVFVPAIEDLSDNALEWLFVHELMHVFLNEMKVENQGQADHQQEHEEHVASSLASAFIWLRESLTEEPGGESTD
jgi:hypothetical protein